MNAALLDTPIIIEHVTEAKNEIGEVIQSWTPFARTLAQHTSRPGREFYDSSRLVSEAHCYFTIRHIDGITAKMRVRCGSVVYEIVDPRLSDKRRESIMLECKVTQ